MDSKTCFKCNLIKPLTDFYKHKQMGDGHLNKCKDCAKKDVREREMILSDNPEWKEQERTRHRRKYYRLGYKDMHKPTSEIKKRDMGIYIHKYPEKSKSRAFVGKLKSVNGNLHHWSYNKEHWKDVIDITPKHHYKAHRFIIYDQERMMYRRSDNNELLDTREKHEAWINWCIENKED